MKYVNPNELKIGDKIKYVAHESWLNKECDNSDLRNPSLKLGKVYKVFGMGDFRNGHMALPYAKINPLVKNNKGEKCGTAWWGSWEYADNKLDLSHIKPYGIVKFLAEITHV